MAKNYSFETFDDPVDISFAATQNIPTFTNLLGINNEGLIAGFYGSGNPGDPNQGFLLTPTGTFTPEDFPPTSQNPVTGNEVLQTQMTGLNDNGVEVGYFYNTNNGVPVDLKAAGGFWCLTAWLGDDWHLVSLHSNAAFCRFRGPKRTSTSRQQWPGQSRMTHLGHRRTSFAVMHHTALIRRCGRVRSSA
jgi:hypothetical protein